MSSRLPGEAPNRRNKVLVKDGMELDPTFLPADLAGARTILAVQPHYDDNDLGAGGTLAALSMAGARVIYLTVTDDQVGVIDPTLPPGDTEAALRREQAEAGRLIGVAEQRWLGYPDAGPIDYYALREDMLLAIRDLRPDVVFTVDPWLPYEFHRDHILTGTAVSEAIGLYGFPRLKVRGKADPSYRPHTLSGVVYYFTHTPNTLFDVTSTHALMQQAVRCYRSQFSQEEMERLILQLEQQAREAARDQAYELAEPLKLLHPSQLHIRTDTWKR
jgi:N,N'-diacetylchitobiose non-reducing end deacetylase